jgi:hypothetical protein
MLVRNATVRAIGRKVRFVRVRLIEPLQRGSDMEVTGSLMSIC